jgi:hypothetical protein
MGSNVSLNKDKINKDKIIIQDNYYIKFSYNKDDSYRKITYNYDTYVSTTEFFDKDDKLKVCITKNFMQNKIMREITYF